MKIAIGCDHAGVAMKNAILPILEQLDVEWKDCGTESDDSCDYPDFGEKVAEEVSNGSVERGILVCGTGIGMSIVANKFPGVRAALCSEDYSAKMSRMHNDANMLVIPGRVINADTAKNIVTTWFKTDFEGGRHQRRLDKIRSIEQRLYK